MDLYSRQVLDMYKKGHSAEYIASRTPMTLSSVSETINIYKEHGDVEGDENMKIYLLINNKTNQVVKPYKYLDVALMAKNRKGLYESVRDSIIGTKESPYRVEVMDVIE